jgi:hypothetical protein
MELTMEELIEMVGQKEITIFALRRELAACRRVTEAATAGREAREAVEGQSGESDGGD